MNSIRIAAIALIVAGVLGLVYGGFSFTKDTTKAEIGPFKFKVEEKESVNVPQWLSIGAIVLGGVVLALGFRKT